MKQIQLGQVEGEFRKMEILHKRLQDTYTRAFGSAKERPALQALVSNLQRMYENRLATEKLGNPGAGAQATRLHSEIEKLSKR
jgi:hypothetical protein